MVRVTVRKRKVAVLVRRWLRELALLRWGQRWGPPLLSLPAVLFAISDIWLSALDVY